MLWNMRDVRDRGDAFHDPTREQKIVNRDWRGSLGQAPSLTLAEALRTGRKMAFAIANIF